jgi:gliding motility-associated-like protein
VQPGTGDSISQYLSNNANVIEKVTYTVTPTAFTTSNKACVGNPKSVDVFVRRPTIPELGLDRDGLCFGESVVIDAGNFPSGKYSWFVNDVKTKDTLSQKTIVVPMGTTKISVGYINTCGLPFKDSVRFTSKQNVAVYFDRGDTCLGINTSFTPHQITTEENVTSWGWKMVNTGDSANSTALNPSYSYVFPNTGKQLIHLTAYSDGCKIGDTTRVINIKNCAIKVDNVFTPNGDGHNDAWRIEGIEDFPNADIVIFNRWGVIVHHIPGTALVPWDGTNDRGEKLENGSFYYVITLNKVSGSNQIVKGCVTIITE